MDPQWPTRKDSREGRARLSGERSRGLFVSSSGTPWPVWLVLLFVAWRIHVGAADGGDYAAKLYRDMRSLGALGEAARLGAQGAESTLEVSMVDLASEPSEPDLPPPPAVKEKREPAKETKPPETKPEEVQKKEERKIAIVVEKKPPPEALPLRMDKRVAIQQHVKPNQEDNPTANQIAEEANHVEQETRATQTSHDENDPNPTPGGNHAGASSETGDSDKTKIADSDEHAGEKDRAPGEKGKEHEILAPKRPTPEERVATLRVEKEPPQARAEARPSGDHRMAGALPPDGASATSPTSSPIVDGPGGWSFNPLQPKGAAGTSQGPGLTDPKNPLAGTGKRSPTPLGLGEEPAPGRTSLSLSHQDVLAVYGADEIRKDRVADGERRKSEHRGRWVASDFRKWKNAIENYVASVKPGNQTSLNAARVPFAKYLNEIHNRIHPIFGDSFLDSLDGLPPTSPLSDMRLITRLEIVVSKEGKLVKIGVVKTSGVTSFDLAALDSVDRAAPFGSAPSAIISPDGNVYLHWEFHRNRVYACSTMNASPFMINAPPGPVPTEERSPTKPPSSPEKGFENPTELRHGERDVAPAGPSLSLRGV